MGVPSDHWENYKPPVPFTFELAQIVAQQERERIIKLLESDPENWITLGGGAGAGYEAAIALIKGENK